MRISDWSSDVCSSDLGGVVAVVCEDDVLDPREEANLDHVCRTLGLHLRDLRAMNLQAWEDLVVARINDGRPPTLGDPPMHARRGEIAYAAFEVALLKADRNSAG